jgi:beta-glucanase (GH16 family)
VIRFITQAVLLWTLFVVGVAHAGYPVYADGDLAPLGAPDGLINGADYLIAARIAGGPLTPTSLEFSHGDLYPAGAPDGVINLQDLLLLQQRLLAPAANSYVENLDLFTDGAATVSVDVNGTIATTTLTVGRYIGPGATVINDPNFTDPADPGNTIWHFSSSGGTANVFLGTANLSADPILDSGFDLSGAGLGQLVFDIQVNSLSPGAILTVKIDSGYPNLGQVALSPSQYTLGSWRRVAINFADLVPQGTGLDLGNVVNAFVLEVTGGNADFYLDNIFVTHACPVVDGCNAAIKTKADTDADGVPDSDDLCPGTPPGSTVNAAGCPVILVWSDEFDGTALDLTNWSYETGYGSFGWGNDEWQLYTNSPNNVSVAGGNLMINARCANPPSCGKRNGTITSGRINSLNKFAFKYGKVEARIKPPVGNGAWSAFWMLGKNYPQVGWPRSGEIDVMEIHNLYSNEFTTHFTMHWCDDAKSSNPCLYNPGWTYVSQFRQDLSTSLGDDFHVFSAEWDANGVIGKIDGIPYFSLPINPATMEEFLEEFFLILNVAIGGTLGGAPDASTPWPQTMLVDYVRVYQEVGGNGTYTIGAGPVSPELGVYTESHTQSVLAYSRIINGADFGGNVTNNNENSTAVTPLDGSKVLAANFTNTGKTYGGFIFDFTLGRDISAYQTLKFGIDASAMSNFANLTVQIENPNGGQPAPKVSLSAYTPTVSGNWAFYEIPLNDFLGQAVALDLTNMLYLGFWNARTTGGSLTFGTLYFDDIHFAGGS